MTDNSNDRTTTGATRPDGANSASAHVLQLFGQVVRAMMLQREAVEASAMPMLRSMQGAGAFDEALVRATRGVVADWLCRGNNDPATHAVASTALRLLDDAYWQYLALDLFDAYLSYATLI